MKPLRLAVFAAAAALALSACSQQPTARHKLGVGPTATVNTQPVQNRTYSASFSALTPAASATDIATITGAANTIVAITKVSCTGTATAASQDVLSLVKRSTADTGTATTVTAVPNSSGNVAAVAVVKKYAANPTLGTAVGTVRTAEMALGEAASTTVASGATVWDFGTRNNQPITLLAANEQLAINNGGVSFPSGASLSCTVEWTEQ